MEYNQRSRCYKSEKDDNCNKNKNSANEFNNAGCGDIPNGFQDLDPQLFLLIGEILGNILAGNIPFNVQNALGNWFELIGQVILTFNAQQQYFQGGPGSYYNPKNYNMNNSFCNSTQSNNASQNNSSTKEESKKSDDNSSKSKSSNENKKDKIEEIELRINELILELEKIKNEI